MEINKIYHGNCLQVMKNIPDKMIDLTITSPPYDSLKIYNGVEWNFKIFQDIADELYRVTNDGGVIVWIVNDATIKGSETGTSFRQALYFKSIGFNLHDTMIWRKSNAFNFGSNYCYRQEFEYMFIFSKGKPNAINFICDVPAKMSGQKVKGARKHADGTRDIVSDFVVGKYRKRGNVWDFATARDNYGHPAVFPEDLVRDHILTWSNPGDLVLDPMCGSGTTCKAAVKAGRNFIGIEIVEEYCKIANERVELARNGN